MRRAVHRGLGFRGVGGRAGDGGGYPVKARHVAPVWRRSTTGPASISAAISVAAGDTRSSSTLANTTSSVTSPQTAASAITSAASSAVDRSVTTFNPAASCWPRSDVRLFGHQGQRESAARRLPPLGQDDNLRDADQSLFLGTPASATLGTTCCSTPRAVTRPGTCRSASSTSLASIRVAGSREQLAQRLDRRRWRGVRHLHPTGPSRPNTTMSACRRPPMSSAARPHHCSIPSPTGSRDTHLVHASVELQVRLGCPARRAVLIGADL